MEFYVNHPSFGRVVVDRDTKADAAAWAQRAFGRTVARTLRRVVTYRLCSTCDCAPCVCDRRRRRTQENT